MRILYVTPMWSSLPPLLYSGDTHAKGMPAFLRPLFSMLERGYDIDMIVADPFGPKPLSVRHQTLKRLRNIRVVPWRPGLRRIADLVCLQALLISRTSKQRYDFVYCHGSLGALGVCASLLKKVPVAQRLYGTFLASEVQRSDVGIFLRHPLEYLSFKLPKQFLLVTNDGTRGDVVYKKINKSQNQHFYFWLNGVEYKSPSFKMKKDGLSNVIIYPARIDRWKRQDRAIVWLSKLKLAGYTNLKLKFYGNVYDKPYYDELVETAKKYDVWEQIDFEAPVSADVLTFLYGKTFMTWSFYDYSNLGNVTIEALRSGALLVSLRDGSLDGVVTNGYNGFLIGDHGDLLNIVRKVCAEPELSRRIRSNAKSDAGRNFKSWDERCADEIELICLTVTKNSPAKLL